MDNVSNGQREVKIDQIESFNGSTVFKEAFC